MDEKTNKFDEFQALDLEACDGGFKRVFLAARYRSPEAAASATSVARPAPSARDHR